MNIRNLLLLMTGLLFHPVSGQIQHTHKLELGLGSEWNAFLSPSRLIIDDDVLSGTENWDSGTFQKFVLNNTFSKEGKLHRLKLKVNGNLGIYQTMRNADRYAFRISTSYRLKYASKKYLEFAPEFYRKRREGFNADNAVLATPFSYRLIRVPVGLDFYLGKKSWLKTELGYLHKKYDQPSGERLMYKAPYLEVLYSKKWKTDAWERKLLVESETQIRDYETISARVVASHLGDELLFRIGSREWLYQFNRLLFDFTKSRNDFNIGLGLYHTARIDQNDRSTFHEIGPGAHIDTKGKTLGFKSSIRYTTRNYKNLAPGSGNNRSLKYQYLMMNFEFNLPINETGRIYWRGSFVNRTSNNPNMESLTFRDYFNGYVELGLRWNY
ncbi:MAG: hypothetical protein HRT61_09295 [Ekhidna sp.]|nr:hypothetical protein [Ekhidna sp.]